MRACALASMTGFGSSDKVLKSLGKCSIELRSTNHKFLEIVLHAPPGFLFAEELIKKAIESTIKRGRIVCAINVSGKKDVEISLSRPLLKKYCAQLRLIKKEYGFPDDVKLETILSLPGVISQEEGFVSKEKLWPQVSTVFNQALAQLCIARRKEGNALEKLLLRNLKILKNDLDIVRVRYKKAVSRKSAMLKTDEEKSSFLKDSDITEEIERLSFHLKNFGQKLLKGSPVGKELDFIAQEMQREANTTGAKSCDTMVSALVIKLKSEIEKIREQVQNIE